MNRTSSSALRAAALAAAIAPLSLAAAQDKAAALQETPAAAQPAAAPAPEKPAAPPAKAAGPTITPYGFVLLSGFFDSGPFSNKDNANQVKVPTAADRGGDFIASARGTRIGFRLEGLDPGLIGASKLFGVAEFDFKGGHVATNSAGWNAFVPRLRLGFARAEWKLAGGMLHVLAGQDWGLLLNVNPNTVSYSCDPVFVQSGNLYRRSPQLRAGWDLKAETFGIAVAAGVLSPADADTQGLTLPTAVDTGVGNKSRQPDVEARIAVSAKAGTAFSGTVGVGYHLGKRRYYFTPSAGTIVSEDLTSTLLGVDADFSITPYLEVKGELYDSKGAEDGHNGAFPGAFPSNPGATAAPPSPFEAVTSQGWWAQATLKPFRALWIAAGYGSAEASRSRLADTAGTRYSNKQLHGAVIVNASKSLRLGLEAARTESKYEVDGAFDATQISFGTQLLF